MLATIAMAVFSIIYVFIGNISFMKNFADMLKLKLDISDLKIYIKQYCYFINNNCDGFHLIKMISVFFIFLILLIIYFIRRFVIPSINYTDYLDFTKSNDNNYSIKTLKIC